MADSKSIPAWQRHATDGSTQAATQEYNASSLAIDQVRKFLEDPLVKDAPADKKKTFLLSKNVPEEIIHQVLEPDVMTKPITTDASQKAKRHEYQPTKDLSETDGSKEAAQQEFDASEKVPKGPAYVQTTDGSKEAAQQEFDASKETTHPSVHVQSTDGSREAAEQEFNASKKVPQDPSQVKTTDGSREAAEQEFQASKATSFDASGFRASIASNAPSSQSRKDVPPIITYPEFLVQPQKPPPLVTVSRLVDTAYIAGALVASAYAVSKYLIAPMSENLNESRHDFFDHAQIHAQTFNDKLGTIVSKIPSSGKTVAAASDNLDSDLESDVSDPTELFHRDFGTQTSPGLSRRASISSAESEATKPESMVSKHATRLRIMQSHLSELLSDNEKNGATNGDTQTILDETRHYVDTLYYTPPPYQYGGDASFNSTGASKEKNDAALSLKAEIRGVKGVLLSAKRFPTAARAGA